MHEYELSHITRMRLSQVIVHVFLIICQAIAVTKLVPQLGCFKPDAFTHWTKVRDR